MLPETESRLPRVFDDCWGLAPQVRRKVAPAIAWRDVFSRWSINASSARLFTGGTAQRIGRAFATTAEHALQIYKDYTGEPLTVLLDDVASHEVERLRTCICNRSAWRAYSTIATLSSQSAGIGFHAGHEDSVIVQLSGSRRWRVWSPECIENDYRLSLMECPGLAPVQPRLPASDPCLDVLLEPGDMLYVPPFFAHEGTTVEESVSLGLGWRGVWLHWLLSDLLPGNYTDFECASHRTTLFALIPDPPANLDQPIDLATWLLQECSNLANQARLSVDPRQIQLAIASKLCALARPISRAT